MDHPAFTPIGVVRTPYLTAEDTPVQAALNREAEAVVEVHADYRDALLGLDGFSHVWLLTWLHASNEAGPVPLRQVPFLMRPTSTELGLLATRTPRRPNPIGLSLVRLESVDGDGRLRIKGVDLLDGTPVLDLKPYVEQFDRPDGEVRSGWFDTVEMRPGIRPSDLGPPA